MTYLSGLVLLLWSMLSPVLAAAASPSLTTINDTTWQLSNGDSFQMTIDSSGYAYSLQWNGRELVGNATGGYVDWGGKTTVNYTTPPEIWAQTDSLLHVNFPSYFADVHYILFSGLVGHFQYVVNNNLGEQGEVRALYRLDPLQFTHGRTNCKDAPLPNINEILTGLKVQDETWRTRTGGYITKYDFSCFVRDLDFHGLYGDDVGAWYIAPSKDYYIGDQLKQELMVHRETKTDDAVMLHYYHGTHYMEPFQNDIPVGKMWGPWLFYINDGDQDDVLDRKIQEEAAWPYPWINDTKYQSRADVKGRLELSDGRPAAGAAVFLGDEDCSETYVQGTNFQYTSYADDEGNFRFEKVRTEKDYCFIAWSTGGELADVDGNYNGTIVNLANSTQGTYDMGTITWNVSSREVAWQIGDFDRKTAGFKYGGAPAPYQHGLGDASPANLVYAIGINNPGDWYFAQTAMGNWSVVFDPAPANKSGSAVLTLSFAGYTLNTVNSTGLNVSMNGHMIGGAGRGRGSDGALHRSATTSGSWYQTQIDVPGETLLTDRFNQLDLSLTENERWAGVLWDALKLEWA